MGLTSLQLPTRLCNGDRSKKTSPPRGLVSSYVRLFFPEKLPRPDFSAGR